MTKTQIETRQARDNVRYELAKQIRQLLDEAKKFYGPAEWEVDDIEEAIQDLVFTD